ncbi:uncharacterized protein LOC105439804 [Strongylocentrotus purpuratus]|uniref:Uncharacterized protein n=1 Tax=Strongylocentrotus purpuratus TaxID=7668 RepID=A0A7M7HKM4_STRPU|nr:uncharacterized protein LOC105439804 [Strongylocentrotus purpuratus]|eukprot:XP_011667503.1 PREDICTED: uncharacterized protein LOC105439804 [Strongylocentrotus purpuratus]
MAQTDTPTEKQPTRDASQKDLENDNAKSDDSDKNVRIANRTLTSNDDNDIVDDDDDGSNVDIAERLGEFSQANDKSIDLAAMSGAKKGERQTFIHSYSISKSSWRSWASKVAATSNIDVALRNISLLHACCSLLLILMGIMGVVTKSYMSYLVIPIWSPIFFFLPTSFTGLLTYSRLRSHSSIQRLIILSSLSTLLSLCLCIVFASFIFRDGQLESDCRPSPAILSSACRQSVYRVLINAVIVFIYVIELIASSSSLLVCLIVKPGCAKKSFDTEQLLISRTSMSYKRLAAADEPVDYFEDRSDPLTNNNASNNMYPRSLSAPAIVNLSTTRPYTD